MAWRRIKITYNICQEVAEHKDFKPNRLANSIVELKKTMKKWGEKKIKKVLAFEQFLFYV